MTPELTMIIGAIAGFVVLVAVAVVWWMNRTPHIVRHEDEVLPLFGGMTSGAMAEADAGVMAGGAVRQQPRVPTPPVNAAVTSAPPIAPPVRPATTSEVASPAVTTVYEPHRAPAAASAPPQDTVRPESSPKILEFTTARAVAPAPAATAGAPANAPVMSSTGVPGTMVEGHLLRFSVPAEGTLQFLPGRLEIASGVDTGREIRFVRVPGPDGTVVTFGRSDGELYRHIQLRDQTVSRQHARLRLEDTRWHLLNLSQTNPVVRNGHVLSNGEEQALDDGDRIEMGEVLFTFRSR